jgi:type 9 secretion system plug protein
MKSKKIATYILLYFIFLFSIENINAQAPDSIYLNNIKTVRLYNSGNQLSIPVINLNSSDQVELHFDDLDADVKYYYYTYQLCNSDWTPVNINQFDYLKGFTQMKISTYRFSSIALTRYTHYQAVIPDRNGYPVKSGNYILKVFLNGDTSQLAFTKRLMVVENKASVLAKVIQPYNPDLFQTHQRLQFTVGIKGLDAFNAAQQVKVIILQNYRWDDALKNFPPTFVRGSTLEYNSENIGVFPAGKEWRWLDITDFHLQSDRVLTADYNKNSTEVYVKPDGPRDAQRYVYYRDYNGMYLSSALRGVNPLWQSDYATVHFSFVPPNGNAYPQKDIYLYGQLTNYEYTDSLKMIFNPDKKIYETHLFLKEGYYDYAYVAVDKSNPALHTELDGNYYETENLYTILVYYKSFTDRSDQLIGIATFDSRTDRPGLSF